MEQKSEIYLFAKYYNQWLETNFFFTILLMHHLQVDGPSLTHSRFRAAEVSLRTRVKTIRYEFFLCIYRVHKPKFSLRPSHAFKARRESQIVKKENGIMSIIPSGFRKKFLHKLYKV